MPNLLKIALVENIRELHLRGWSQRHVAQTLGINRETVARYLKLGESEPKRAIAPSSSIITHGGSFMITDAQVRKLHNLLGEGHPLVRRVTKGGYGRQVSSKIPACWSPAKCVATKNLAYAKGSVPGRLARTSRTAETRSRASRQEPLLRSPASIPGPIRRRATPHFTAKDQSVASHGQSERGDVIRTV